MGIRPRFKAPDSTAGAGEREAEFTHGWTGMGTRSLERRNEMNHERHERHENRGPNHRWLAPDCRTRSVMTAVSEGPTPFVFFVSCVVPTAPFSVNHPGPCSGGERRNDSRISSVPIGVYPWQLGSPGLVRDGDAASPKPERGSRGDQLRPAAASSFALAAAVASSLASL